MTLQIIDRDFSVCKLDDPSLIDLTGGFCFIGKTDEELSLVCETQRVPARTTACEHGWKAFRIEGELDFSLIGILSKLSALLAEEGIGIFAISTFNTDYILTKAENFDRAIAVLRQNGYAVSEAPPACR
ncbi:ACT domain-containing protein [Butyricicoccus faecihominis]|uniref:ACT domain-containing protein n=1 Tax=Butyricicoccaceae TaxID=3085642 RepID=UPI00247AF12E|nr:MULTISPECIES: ACT domain-containing protein [Butyricicoccaceae]MCQ5131392.1 ACT domain-containing protein [Butyricicoccus faecihominis]WNX86211.1 ACT domain-containing protein [Agathobaculum sp. NTUH-O15-33]